MTEKVHLSEEQLALHLTRDAEDAAAVAEHLAACAECGARFESLKQVMAAVNASGAMTPPARGENYGEQVWRRLEPRLAAEPKQAWWQLSFGAWLAPARLALAGAMAVLLIAAYYLGTLSRPPGSDVEIAVQPPQVRERILLVAVGDHLERSQMVLAELVNTQANGLIDITREQIRARELADDNRLYRQTAASAGEQGLAVVLEELERVLVEIANSPSDVSSADLERIRKRLESQGILFKVRVMASRVRGRVRPAAGERTGLLM
jgi:hypothetical protein